MATYSNGIQQLSGRINLASFSAPQGLTQIGDTSYRASGASGTLIHEQPGTSGLGTLVSGATSDQCRSNSRACKSHLRTTKFSVKRKSNGNIWHVDSDTYQYAWIILEINTHG
ncbi:MAG: hypothetical protein CM15mP51_05800 [Porticoccaceae bacterium]|nr:MAG: hypothetical protein CM15mP51_05800 [Porticoccaceae bacterium]